MGVESAHMWRRKKVYHVHDGRQTSFSKGIKKECLRQKQAFFCFWDTFQKSGEDHVIQDSCLEPYLSRSIYRFPGSVGLVDISMTSPLFTS